MNKKKRERSAQFARAHSHCKTALYNLGLRQRHVLEETLTHVWKLRHVATPIHGQLTGCFMNDADERRAMTKSVIKVSFDREPEFVHEAMISMNHTTHGCIVDAIMSVLRDNDVDVDITAVRESVGHPLSLSIFSSMQVPHASLVSTVNTPVS